MANVLQHEGVAALWGDGSSSLSYLTRLSGEEVQQLSELPAQLKALWVG